MITSYSYPSLESQILITGLYSKERPKIALVLSGGGAKGIAQIPTLQLLDSLNIPLEIMKTDAACRTWTVLVSEGRCVCAFIKPQR